MTEKGTERLLKGLTQTIDGVAMAIEARLTIATEKQVYAKLHVISQWTESVVLHRERLIGALKDALIIYHRPVMILMCRKV